MNYNIIKSDFITNVSDITWTALTADLPHFNNFKEELILDYDKETYTSASALNTQQNIGLQFTIEKGETLNVSYMYLNWKDIKETNYIYVYSSDDLNTWYAVEFESCYGDANVYLPSTLRVNKSTEGKIICKFTDPPKKKYYRVVFQNTTNFASGTFLSVYSCWFGNNLDIIEPDINKTDEIYIYNINKTKTFDGTYYNNIMGGHKKSKWNIKWSYLTKEEKDLFIIFINNIIYNPKMLLIDYDNINNWCEGICIQDSISIEESDDYLYTIALEIQEL